MTTPQNIPVSYEFFKKYTYHEEWVERMLKVKANGNRETYEALMSCKESKEKALRSYYEAFYLRPKIREKSHIRFKAAPKKIKDKLLVIPVQDTGTANKEKKVNEVMQDAVDDEIAEEQLVGEKVSKTEEAKQRILMTRKDIYGADDDPVVEDDNEPLGSPEVSSTPQQTKANAPVEMQAKDGQVVSSPKALTSPKNNNKMTSKESVSKTSETIAKEVTEQQSAVSTKTLTDKHQEIMETNNNNNKPEKTKTESNKSPTSIADQGKHVNYQDLIPYVHCCPLTLKQFRKYSNINQLVNELCKTKHMDDKQQRMIAQRCYILFYLVPEQRKSAPINKIQILDNCPEHIKSKFYVIPSNLYLKKQNLDKPQEKCRTENTNAAESVENKETQSETVSEAVNNRIETNIVEAAKGSSQPEESSVINNIGQNKLSPRKGQSLQNEGPKEINPNKQTAIPETNINTNQQTLTTHCPNQQTDTFINLPVSLDEFKKYTHFEEIVDNLFKIKAQDNKELYNKYKNSPEAFDSTLLNYYRAFYLTPIIREAFPIRYKALPNFVRNRLLQIPEGVNAKTSLNSLKIEELVSVVFYESVENEKETTAPATSGEQIAKTLNNSNISSSTSPTNTTGITIKTEKDTESSDSDNKTKSPSVRAKRTTTEDMKSPLAKRQKTQQTQDYSENTQKTKKSYKELLPYAHCCPVSISDFRKYTNVSELFTGYCLKRYNSVEKLPYMLQRAYVLYYLAPENRKFKPFNKLVTLSECPADLREKIHQIPENLYLKGENINAGQTLEQMETEEFQTENLKENQANNITPEETAAATKSNNNRKSIEILENRLLPPTQLPINGHVNESSQCLDNNCIFHYVTYVDFTQMTNFLHIVGETPEISVIKNIFKKCVYKILKEQSCDEKYVFSGTFLCKFLKCEQICEKCDDDVQALLKEDSISAHNISAKESFANAANNETVIERSEVDNERLQTGNTDNATIEVESRGYQAEVESRESQTVNKSFKGNSTTNATKNSQSQESTPKKQEDLWKNLKSEKVFQLFCKKLLAKLRQTVDNAEDFYFETYEIFLQCNEIPLEKLLNDFCCNNKEIAERILNEQELRETLQRYYYHKYLTNAKFSLKYPVQIKEKSLEEKQTNEMETPQDKTTEINKETVKITSPVKQTQNISPTTNPIENPTSNSNNNVIEKAKRIYFRQVEKTNTLSYILRTSFGLKQLILRKIFTLTYQEFLQLTNIYEGKELYNDNHLTECMYRYAIQTPAVWPTNLFITLKDLCEFLHAKNIRFQDYSTMLKYISPKLLHWSVLLSCTNILDSIKIDYEKRTGKMLDTNDIKALKQECIEYYNRCWKYEKWLGGVPLVNEEFYKDYLHNNVDQGDVTMLDELALQEVGVEADEVSDDVVLVNNDIEEVVPLPDLNLNKSIAKEKESNSPNKNFAEKTMEMNTSHNKSVKEFNCIILPNTQQQIEMLPVEETVSNDPLNNSRNANISRVSSANSENYEVVCLGELIANDIKTEPNNSKLLTNLRFYEDDNSNMQCIPCSEEIVNLDDSVSQVCENLLPSQIEFEDVVPELILSDELVQHENSNSIMNLAQRLPSSAESLSETARSQHNVPNVPNIQMANVSLRSSGENVSQEFKHEKEIVLEDEREEVEVVKVNTQEFELLQAPAESFVVYAEAQRFPSTFEETPTFSGGTLEPTTSSILQSELICNIIKENLNTADTQNSNSVSNETPQQPTTLNSIQPSKQTNTLLPKRRGIEKTYVSAKNSKSVATVRPIKNSNFVPQIQHNTRPLLTKPAYTASSANRDTEIQVETAAVLEQSPSLSLTPIEEDVITNEQQNSCLQFQLQSVGTHIYISQEFQKNCSVFNNTSLLRLVDRNYQQQSQTRLSSQSEEVVAENQQQLQNDNTSLILTPTPNDEAEKQEQPQPIRRTTRRSSMLGSQPKTSNIAAATTSSTTPNKINPPVSPKRITRRSSLNKDSNDKNFCVRNRKL